MSIDNKYKELKESTKLLLDNLDAVEDERNQLLGAYNDIKAQLDKANKALSDLDSYTTGLEKQLESFKEVKSKIEHIADVATTALGNWPKEEG